MHFKNFSLQCCTFHILVHNVAYTFQYMNIFTVYSTKHSSSQSNSYQNINIYLCQIFFTDTWCKILTKFLQITENGGHGNSNSQVIYVTIKQLFCIIRIGVLVLYPVNGFGLFYADHSIPSLVKWIRGNVWGTTINRCTLLNISKYITSRLQAGISTSHITILAMIKLWLKRSMRRSTDLV